MENDKKLAIEYILSNGTFPGWTDRLESWRKTWKSIEKDTVVYRGQGHEKESIIKLHNKPEELLPGIKNVISTSLNKNHVGKQFTNYKMKKLEACCLFEITLKPGIHFFDFNTISGISDQDIEDFLQLKKTLDPKNIIPWPKIDQDETGKIIKVTPPKTVIYNYLLKKKTEEQEILIDGREGKFTMTGSYIDTLDRKPIKIYKVTYAPKSKGGSKTKKQQKKRRKTRKQ
jgi:hypothetical protein